MHFVSHFEQNELFSSVYSLYLIFSILRNLTYAIILQAFKINYIHEVLESSVHTHSLIHKILELSFQALVTNQNVLLGIEMKNIMSLVVKEESKISFA